MTPRWDSYDAYLFDIDGTLLHCRDAVHYFGFCHALHLLSGKPLNLDGVIAHGNTDIGILCDALLLAGCNPEHWRPELPGALKAMTSFVQEREAEMQVEAIPGATETLRYLQRKGAILGVATGNLAGIGQLKLKLSELETYFVTHGFSDGLETRTTVFERALHQLRNHYPDVNTVCVVGDTPSDIRAAHANRLPAIAVATGIFNLSELMNESPEHCVTSLLELRANAS